MRLKIKSILLISSLLLLGSLILANATLWYAEPIFIFANKAYPIGNWHPQGLKPQDVWLYEDKKIKVHGWYLPHAQPKAVVLYLHGNNGNVTDRYKELIKLHDVLSASVLTFDYRGFGKSEGIPEEKTMIADANVARLWLAKKEHIDPKQIILLGRSLGTGVAVELASQHHTKALILISAFSSLPDLIQYHYPFLAAKRLLHNQFNSLAKIGSFFGPLLLIHSDADQLIPLTQAEQLFANAKGPKQFFIIKGSQHYDPIKDNVYQEIRRFLNKK